MRERERERERERGRFFCNFIFKLTGSGRVRFRAGFLPKPGPVSGFFLTQTRPYSLSDRVKPDPLGSGREGYPQVELKLSSLSLIIFFILNLNCC